MEKAEIRQEIEKLIGELIAEANTPVLVPRSVDLLNQAWRDKWQAKLQGLCDLLLDWNVKTGLDDFPKDELETKTSLKPIVLRLETIRDSPVLRIKLS